MVSPVDSLVALPGTPLGVVYSCSRLLLVDHATLLQGLALNKEDLISRGR